MIKHFYHQRFSRRPDFVDFNHQPTPSTYYDIITDHDDDSTPIDASLADKKVVEGVVVPTDEDINNKITTGDDNSLASDIEPPPPNKIM